MLVKYLKLLLLPLSFLYGSIMYVRNKLYDRGILLSKKFSMPVIVVGNLTVGGTGKTPHVEYLLRLLHQYKTATLSRGYKRQTKGFILASAQDSAATLGDEPFQYYQDFPDVAVAVCEDRVRGIENLQQQVPGLELVVLDDALQHRPVEASCNILLTDYNRLFYKDFVLPAGLLREPKTGAKRADVVVVTKCPVSLANTEKQQIVASITKYTTPGTPVFFSNFKYGAPVSIGSTKMLQKKVLLLTGIANPVPLKKYLLDQGYEVQHSFSYPDHYQYKLEDLQKLELLLEDEKHENSVILTTSKDAVKLRGKELIRLTSKLPVFYVPIEVTFGADQKEFNQLIRQHVKSRLNN